MILNLSINNIKPLGFNNSYFLSSIGGYARRIKKPETKNYEDSISEALYLYNKEIAEFNTQLIPSKFYLHVSYKFHIPLFTKKKSINKRSGDVDGFIKIIQDQLFKHLNADDSEIISVSSKKINSDKYKIYIRIEMFDIENIK